MNLRHFCKNDNSTETTRSSQLKEHLKPEYRDIRDLSSDQKAWTREQCQHFKKWDW